MSEPQDYGRHNFSYHHGDKEDVGTVVAADPLKFIDHLKSLQTKFILIHKGRSDTNVSRKASAFPNHR